MKKTIYILFSCLFLGINAYALSPESVYENLKQAIGDQNRDFPRLEIRKGKSSVLAYNRIKNIIFIDEAALEICASFGSKSDAALAFLMAHELTHFYQEHDWKVAGFGSRFLAAKETYHRHVIDEQEADLFGAFLTHLAGYQSVKIIPDIFDEVYKVYGLNESLDNYPSLTDRKKVSNKVCKKVNELIQLFETANHLVAINEHLTAAAAYEHILKFVKYKELYKNAGTALVAAVAGEEIQGIKRFYFPLEIDFSIPLRDGAADKKELLQKAIEYLSSATRMDNSDIGNFINLSSAYILNEQYHDAAELLAKLARLGDTTQQAKIELLKGILAAKQGNINVAKTAFEKAKTTSQENRIQQLVSLNLSLLEPKETMITTSSFHPSTEQIDGIDLGYQNDFDFQEVTIENHYTQEENNFGRHETATAKLTHISGYSNTIAILSTDKKSARTSDNLGIGTTFESIQQKHPNGRILNHSRGFYFVIPQRKLFFLFSTQERVSAWGTYERY